MSDMVKLPKEIQNKLDRIKNSRCFPDEDSAELCALGDEVIPYVLPVVRQLCAAGLLFIGTDMVVDEYIEADWSCGDGVIILEPKETGGILKPDLQLGCLLALLEAMSSQPKPAASKLPVCSMPDPTVN